jgi:hypothetical protein
MNTRFITSLFAASMIGASAMVLAAPPSAQEQFVAAVLAPVAPHQEDSSRANTDFQDAREIVVSHVLTAPLQHVETSIVTAESRGLLRDPAINSYL